MLYFKYFLQGLAVVIVSALLVVALGAGAAGLVYLGTHVTWAIPILFLVILMSSLFGVALYQTDRDLGKV